jgi:UDP-N-acetylmuramoyl-L-alanyl-D-glutamate--2,6-diaminopimelate ligase
MAVGMAIAGDLILIAGKGHEDYQILGVNKIHFDDRQVAREELGRDANV